MKTTIRKLHNRREPPGLERVVLGKLPAALLAGTAGPGLAVLINRLLLADKADAGLAVLQMTDILAIATVLTVWTAVLTIAIGCIVVIALKGPAYVADAYYMDDAAPGQDDSTEC